MILMQQMSDVTANENARYKRNELEFIFLYTYNRCAFYMIIRINKYECTYVLAPKTPSILFKTSTYL